MGRWGEFEIEMLNSDLSLTQVAAITGRTYKAVLQKRQRDGIAKSSNRGRPRTFSDEERAEMVRRYNNYESLADIAASMGCSRTTVSNAVKEYYQKEKNNG